jgi:hypothetical protein
MSHAPVLLVSCTRCQRLHAPLRDDTANPLCGRCTLPGARSAPRRPRSRSRARAAG